MSAIFIWERSLRGYGPVKISVDLWDGMTPETRKALEEHIGFRAPLSAVEWHCSLDDLAKVYANHKPTGAEREKVNE